LESTSGIDGLSAGEAAKTLAFWILMFAGALVGLGFYAFTAHVVPHATDLGVSTTTAALILTVGSVGAGAGTLLAGTITRRLGYGWALVLLTLANGVVMFFFVWAGHVWALYILSFALGFAFSAVVPVRMGVIPPLFGLRAVGTIIGLVSLAFSVGALVGPFVAGYVFDSTGSYAAAFIGFGVVLVIGAASLRFLRPPQTNTATDTSSIWRAGDRLE